MHYKFVRNFTDAKKRLILFSNVWLIIIYYVCGFPLDIDTYSATTDETPTYIEPLKSKLSMHGLRAARPYIWSRHDRLHRYTFSIAEEELSRFDRIHYHGLYEQQRKKSLYACKLSD